MFNPYVVERGAGAGLVLAGRTSPARRLGAVEASAMAAGGTWSLGRELARAGGRLRAQDQ